MKSVVRTPVAAAAMLLASMGALLAATPAQAQHDYDAPRHAIVAPQAGIERFVVRHPGSLEAGSEVRFRLVGTTGGRATIDIPGIVNNLPMAETRPGVYEAGYVIRWRDNPELFTRAVATLQHRFHRVSARVEMDERGPRWARRGGDRQAPQITDITPSHGERVSDRGRTRITARVHDERSGVESVTLRVDGRDVTGLTRVEDGEVRYREDLAPGRHVAELVVRDRAGNASRRSWTFDVVGTHYSYYQRW
jgi:hypothetical protein